MMNNKILFLAIVFAIILINPVFAFTPPSSNVSNTYTVCDQVQCNYSMISTAVTNLGTTPQTVYYINVSKNTSESWNITTQNITIQGDDTRWAGIYGGSTSIIVGADNFTLKRFFVGGRDSGGTACDSATVYSFCAINVRGLNVSDVNFTSTPSGGGSIPQPTGFRARNTSNDSYWNVRIEKGAPSSLQFRIVGGDNHTLNNFNNSVDRMIIADTTNVNITNSNFSGFYLELSNVNNSYVNLNFVSNSEYGIYVDDTSRNNTFRNNTYKNNNYGIYMLGGIMRIEKETMYSINNSALYLDDTDINGSQIYMWNITTGVNVNSGSKINISNTTCESAVTCASGVSTGSSLVLHRFYTFNLSQKNTIPVKLTAGVWTIQRINISNSTFGINITNNAAHLIFDGYLNSSTLAASAPNCLLCQWNTSKIATTNIIGGSWVSGNSWINFNGTDTDGDGLADTLTPYTVSGNLASGTGDYAPLVAAGFRKPNITNAFMTPNQSLFQNNLSFSFNVSAGAGSNILNSCNLTVYFPNNSNKLVGNATSQCDGANSSWRLVTYSVPVRADWNGIARAEINVSDNASATSTNSLNLTFDTLLDISFGINDYTATGAQGVNTSFSFPVNISTNESVQFGCGNVFGGEQTNDSTSSNISNIFLYGCQINETKLGNMTGNPPTGLLGSSNVNIPLNRTFTVWFVPQLSNTTNFTKYEWNVTFNLTQSQQYWRNVTITYTVAPQVNTVAVSFANGSNNWDFGTINSGTQVCNVFSLNATGNETASFINLTSAATGFDKLNGFVANESGFNITNGSSKNVHFCFTPTVSANTNFDSGDLNYVYASWIGSSSNAPSSLSSVVATNGTINGFSVTTPLITGTVNAVATTTTTTTSGGGGGKEKKECSLVFSPPKESGLRFTRLDKSLALSITNNEDENFVPSVKIIKPDVSFANDASPYLKIEQIPPNILSGGTEKIFVTASPPDFNVTYEAIMTIGSSKCADANIPITLNVPFDSSFAGLGEKLGIGALTKFLNKSIEDTAIKVWEVLLVIFVITFGSILFFTKKIIPAVIITLFIIIGIGFIFKILGVVGNG